jgi:IS30 family transposase
MSKRRRNACQQRSTFASAKQVIAGYQAGATIYQLGNQFGIDRKTVSRILHRHNIPMRRTSLTPDQVDQAVHLHENGWSTTRIAEQLDSTQRTVQRRLAERGITTRASQTGGDVR